VPPGIYDVRVRQSHTLNNRVAGVTIIAGVNDLDAGTLREGDANADDCVTIVDFSILRKALGSERGQPAYNRQADFNEDGFVSIADFWLLRLNFGVCGD